MNDIERLVAIDQIKQLKARYFRGVDTNDAVLVKSILAADCELDYVGCCTDPTSGRDFIPAMNVVLRGREAWKSDGMSTLGIVSIHQGHQCEIELTSDTTAQAIWAMTDRLHFPKESPFALMTGYGYYYETYKKIEGAWQIKSITIKRIRVEAI